MKIGFTYDLETDHPIKPDDPPDTLAEFDRSPTIDLIGKSLAINGNKVIYIGNVHHLLADISMFKKSVDIVFNIAEGASGRNREAQVPVILELFRIPYVGSDGLTQALTLDKFMTKKILLSSDINTPNYMHIKNTVSSINTSTLNFPLIVKPRWEGSSKGITGKSRVENRHQLVKQVNHIIKVYKQPVLIEEFITGAEYTVAIIGNGDSVRTYIYKVVFGSDKPTGDEYFLSENVENDEVCYISADDLDLKLKKLLHSLAFKTYESVGCLDFGRVDIRIDKSGQPYVLEINPLPSLNIKDTFGILAIDTGMGYTKMIQQILISACKRLKIKNP